MEFLIIPLLAALNRLRGDGRWMPTWLPGRALYYVAPVVGLLSWAVHPPLVAAAFAAAYLAWGIPAWGLLYGLGRYQPDREPDRLAATLLEWAGGNVHLAFFFRHLFIASGLALVSLASGSWWPIGAAVPAAAAFVASYDLAWRWAPRQPIFVAELIVGALWGAMIVAL